MNTGTLPRLEQLDFFSGFCPVQKPVPKPKPHRALTPREKDVLEQVGALNDPLIIEAINLFNGTIVGIVPTEDYSLKDRQQKQLQPKLNPLQKLSNQ
jgi:hypothetical protein